MKGSISAGALCLGGLLWSQASAAPVETPDAAASSSPPTTAPVEVEAQASATPSPSVPTTASRSILTLDDQAFEPRGLDEALELVPGVTLTRLGGPGRSATLMVRGASAGHTQVFVDGVPLSHPAAGAVNLEELPLESVERLELFRGGSPLAFGADAPGGVLNLVTGSVSPGVHLKASLAAGSWGYRRASAGAVLGGPEGALRFQLGALADRGDHPFFFNGGTDYATYDDQVIVLANHDVTRVEASLRAEQTLLPGVRLTLQASQLNKEQGLLGLGQGIVVTRARYDVDQWQGYSRLSTQTVSGLRLEATADGFWRQESLSDPYGEVALVPQESALWSHALGGQARTSGPLTGQVAFDALGLVRLEGARDPQTQRTWGRLRAGTGAQAELYLPKAVVMTALLLDHLVPQEASGKSLTLLSPRAGLEFRGGIGLGLRVNGGAFHRAPGFSELYGNQGNVVGNPELLPERGLNLELGVALEPTLWQTHRLGALRVEGALTAFVSRQEDLILYIQNSQATLRPENLAAGEIWGIEAESRLELADVVQLQSGYTWLLALDRSGIPAQDGLQLPGRPRHALHIALIVGTESLSLRAKADVQSESALEPSHTLMAPGRALLDIGLQSRLPGPELNGVKLYAEVRNLLDTISVMQENIPSPQPLVDVSGFPLPGRTFILGVRWEG